MNCQSQCLGDLHAGTELSILLNWTRGSPTSDATRTQCCTGLEQCDKRAAKWFVGLALIVVGLSLVLVARSCYKCGLFRYRPTGSALARASQKQSPDGQPAPQWEWNGFMFAKRPVDIACKGMRGQLDLLKQGHTPKQVSSRSRVHVQRDAVELRSHQLKAPIAQGELGDVLRQQALRKIDFRDL